MTNLRLLSKALLISLLICSFSTKSFCEEPSIYPPSGVLTFRGLDNKSSPTAVADGRASDLLNVKFDTTGALLKRGGYSTVGTVLDIPDTDFAAIQGIYYTKYSSGNDETIAICGGRPYRYDTDLSPDDWVQLGGLDGTTGADYQYVFATALDTIIFTNDEDTVRKYTESGTVQVLDVSDLTDTLTKAKCLIWYKNYLIFGNTYEGSTERSTRFRWSDVGTIETYDDDNYIDIAALGGQEIEGFAVLYDNLYMFLTSSIYQISLVGGDEIFKVTKVVDGIGCIAKNSLQNITLLNNQQGIMFLDEDKKVYFFNGMNAQYISILIETTMNGLLASRLEYAVSAEDGTDYYLGVSYGGVTENNLLLDFQYQLGEWTKHDQIDANYLARIYDVNGDEQTYYGQYGGFVGKLDTSLKNDVDGIVDTVLAVDTYTTTTASSLQVIYTNETAHTTSGLVGGIIKITGGTGSGQERRIVWNTTSGIVVESAFTTTPDSTSSYSVGAIDAYFTSKWYDCGNPARIKGFGEIFWWADEEADTDVDFTYATDFSDDIATEAVSIAGTTTDAVWGSAIWGTSYWGGVDTVFRQTKMEDNGRYLKFKFQNDDIDETFNIYSVNLLYWNRDFQ